MKHSTKGVSASATCRVYFNKTSDNSKDYLVDHSIIHYLIDPEGEFVTFYGEPLNILQPISAEHALLNPWLMQLPDLCVSCAAKSYTADQIADSICDHIAQWKAAHPEDYHPGREIRSLLKG
jgi:protein SCO1/2